MVSILAIALGAVSIAVPEWAEPLITKASKKLFDKTGGKIIKDLKLKLQGYTGSVPPNHDIEKAIRIAELTSTIRVLEEYRLSEQRNETDNRTTFASNFVATAGAWLREQIGLTPTLKTKSDDELTEKIEKRLNEILSSNGISQLEKALNEVELEVWNNLKKGVHIRGGGDPPEAFRLMFFGRDETKIGWALLFLAYMREALKDNPRTEIAFSASRISKIAITVEDIKSKLSVLSDDFKIAFPQGPVLPLVKSLNTGPTSSSSRRASSVIKFPHRTSVYSAVFSNDGRQFVTGKSGGSTVVWSAINISTRDRGLDIARHVGGVIFASFSPDGSLITTASKDKSAAVWYSSNKLSRISLFNHPKSVNTSQFSPDGMRIATSCWDGSIRVWNIDDEDCICHITLPEPDWVGEGERFDDRCINSAYFSPDGLLILSASSETSNNNAIINSFVHVWDSRTGAKIADFPGNPGGVCCAAFSNDQQFIATAGAFDCSVRVYNALDGVEIARLKKHKDTVWNVSFSPDNLQIVTASYDSWVYVWDLNSNTVTKELPHDAPVHTAYFSPCGTKILTACDDGFAYLWSLR